MDELRIKPGDLSRRLGQDLLEHVWTLDSPKHTEVPVWAKHNLCPQNQTADHESTIRTASPAVEGIEFTNSESRSWSPGTLPSLEAEPEHPNLFDPICGSLLTKSIFDVEFRSPNNALHMHSPKISLFSRGLHTGMQPAAAASREKEDKGTKINSQPQKPSKWRKKKSQHAITTRPSGITKILQSDAPLATRTRSRNVAKFFELGYDSRARPLRKP